MKRKRSAVGFLLVLVLDVRSKATTRRKDGDDWRLRERP